MFTEHFSNQNNLLNFISVDLNGFSGEVPSSIYKFKNLQILVVTDNCLEFNLPQNEICKSTSLTYLFLNGLKTSRCSKKIFPMFSEAYVLKKHFKIDFSVCLFNMTNLKVLQLAGNGISGTLPSNIAIDSKLNNLVLSHNVLRGSIPTNFQLKKMG
jgi:hypothetical protein